MALGYPHPRYLQQELSSQDITEWMAYAKAYPLPHTRLAHMLGTIASMVYNSNRGKDQKALDWDDFFPTLDAQLAKERKQRPLTKAELDAQANAVGNAFLAYNMRFQKE